jgi:uncharacterized membrane protein
LLVSVNLNCSDYTTSNGRGREVEGSVRGFISVNIVEFAKRDSITTRNLSIANLEAEI